MKKLKFLFFPTILALAFGLMLSCAKSSEDNINDTVAFTNDSIDEGVANTNENLEDILEDNNDTAVDLENALTGGGGSSTGSSNIGPQKVYIVGSAVTEKCIFYDCPKSKAVLWDLGGNMTVLDDSCDGSDATAHNDSIYIVGSMQYCVVGPDKKVVVHKLNAPSGYDSLFSDSIAVSSNGDVYVSGTATKNRKDVSVYWKNGELIKSFSENKDWYSEENVAADSNGNVYMPGWMMKSHSVTHATYWKNGNLKKLTSTYDGEATDVAVSGGKVYFSGAHGPICDLPCPVKSGTLAAYWQVGKGMTKVTKVKTAGYPRKFIMRSRASSIHVEGSTVYMAGYVDGFVPVYWKNKIQRELPVEFDLDTCDYCKAEPIDISVVDGKVLVLGDYYDEKDKVDSHYTNGERKAVYWMNNKLHKLCECCGSSHAVAVVVKECVDTSCEQAEWKDQTCSTSSETKDDKAFTKQLGSSADDMVKGVAVDSSNNIYVTGHTYGGLDSNTNSGVHDIFLVKYNSSGTKQWTKQLGTSTADSGLGVTVDSSNNIYVTGHTYGGLDSNTNSGGHDIFLVKYNSSGTKQWTKQLGTSSNDRGYGVTVDSSNNIYVTGHTYGGLDSNTYSGGKDIFLTKFNSSGTKQWTNQLGTSSNDEGFGVSTDSSGNIYVTGNTNGGLDGNTNSGNLDIILVKYNSSGTRQWTQQLGSSENDYGQGVTVDSSDNIYVTGHTLGGLDGNTNSGESDIFLVKYNSSGTKQWTQQLGTPTYEGANGVTVDSSDNIYVTGNTRGKLDTYSGGSDTFLVKYNSSGVKQWTQQFGTSSSDFGIGVTVDSSDNIYVTGNTWGGLDGNTNSGGYDIFLVKYNSM